MPYRLVVNPPAEEFDPTVPMDHEKNRLYRKVETQRTFLIYLDQFETFCIFGDARTTLEAIRNEFLESLANGDTIEIQIKRHDMTVAEMDAAPVQ